MNQDRINNITLDSYGSYLTISTRDLARAFEIPHRRMIKIVDDRINDRPNRFCKENGIEQRNLTNNGDEWLFTLAGFEAVMIVPCLAKAEWKPIYKAIQQLFIDTHTKTPGSQLNMEGY